jgi:hypothetical protein
VEIKIRRGQEFNKRSSLSGKSVKLHWSLLLA